MKFKNIQVYKSELPQASETENIGLDLEDLLLYFLYKISCGAGQLACLKASLTNRFKDSENWS